MTQQRTRCLPTITRRLRTAFISRRLSPYPFSPNTAMHNLKFTAFMRNRLLKVGMGFAVLNVAVFSGHAADPGMKTLHGHVPSVVSHLQKTGDLAPTADLTLTLGLPLRNQEELSTVLQQTYDPASTNYHRFLSPEQF